MAVYRFSASVIGRSSGRSSVAAAAYRAGAELTNERDGIRHDYTRRHGVAHTEILAPDGSPDWVHDRARLWNEVERVERRKDAQLAREITMSLPHELSHEERVELARAFAREEFASRGMVADLAVHEPDRAADERNHHAHVMLTLRPLDGDGFGKKAREWNDRGLIETWRERWAEHQNRALERAGHEARVDHRSLEARGIDREPEPKLGPVATKMERQGRESHAGNDLRETWERNAEREQLEQEAGRTAAELHHARRIAEPPPPPPDPPERSGFGALFFRQRQAFDQEAADRQARIDELSAQLDGRSRMAVFWDKLRGRVGWTADLELKAERQAQAELEERRAALERAIAAEEAREAQRQQAHRDAQEARRQAEREQERQRAEEAARAAREARAATERAQAQERQRQELEARQRAVQAFEQATHRRTEEEITRAEIEALINRSQAEQEQQRQQLAELDAQLAKAQEATQPGPEQSEESRRAAKVLFSQPRSPEPPTLEPDKDS